MTEKLTELNEDEFEELNHHIQLIISDHFSGGTHPECDDPEKTGRYFAAVEAEFYDDK